MSKLSDCACIVRYARSEQTSEDDHLDDIPITFVAADVSAVALRNLPPAGLCDASAAATRTGRAVCAL